MKVWVITSLLEIEQLWNKASLFKSGVRVSLAAESEDCRVESLPQFLSRFARSGRTNPQAHARVRGELMRGRMELQESERQKVL